jgi:hypothetical protein
MEPYKGNLDLVSAEQDCYFLTDNEKTYKLEVNLEDENINLTLKTTGSLVFKAGIKLSDSDKHTLFKIAESLDKVLEIIDFCLKNKLVILKPQMDTYKITFYSVFLNSYLTAEIIFERVVNNLKFATSHLNELVSALSKENTIKTEEINHLKAENLIIKNRILVLEASFNNNNIPNEINIMKAMIADLREEKKKKPNRMSAGSLWCDNLK